MTISAAAIMIATSIVLGGCAAPSPSYVPDPSLTAANAATLYGSRQEHSKLFVPDTQTTIVAIDGTRTGADADTPILVSPGTHTVAIATRYGNTGGGLATQMSFEAGKTYVLRGEVSSRSYASVWLTEKETGETVGEKLTVCLNQSAPIFQAFSACK